MYDKIFNLFVFKILPLYIVLCSGFALIKFLRLWILKEAANTDNKETVYNKILYSSEKLNKSLHIALKSLLITLLIVSVAGVFLWLLILKGENEFEISSKIAFLPPIIISQAIFALMIVYVTNRYEIKMVKTSNVRIKEINHKAPRIVRYVKIIIRIITISLILFGIVNYILYTLHH